MRKRKTTEKTESLRPCEWAGCGNGGEIPAPKSRQSVTRDDPYGNSSPRQRPEEYYWFCPEHAREYNSRWDYFSGMSEDEILAFQKESVIGHRPTWQMGMNPAATDPQKLFEKVKHMFGDPLGSSASNAPPALPPDESNALAVLNLDFPTTKKDIKARYKELVKQVHPDVNRGDKTKEERFKKVNEAYRFLMNCNRYS